MKITNFQTLGVVISSQHLSLDSFRLKGADEGRYSLSVHAEKNGRNKDSVSAEETLVLVLK